MRWMAFYTGRETLYTEHDPKKNKTYEGGEMGSCQRRQSSTPKAASGPRRRLASNQILLVCFPLLPTPPFPPLRPDLVSRSRLSVSPSRAGGYNEGCYQDPLPTGVELALFFLSFPVYVSFALCLSSLSACKLNLVRKSDGLNSGRG